MLSAIRTPTGMTHEAAVLEVPVQTSGPAFVEQVSRTQAERFSNVVFSIHRAASFAELTVLTVDWRRAERAEWEMNGAQRHADLRWYHLADRLSARPLLARVLTSREHTVLQGVSRGLTDFQIGQSLGIARRTASKHVEAILEKLGVETRTAAAQTCRTWR